MNLYYLIAGVLAIVLGVIHSILGEVLIFRRLRNSKLQIRHYNTLWSTWHLVTLFGFGFGAILIVLSWDNSLDTIIYNISTVISVLFFISAIYWLISTKGKHPAWVVLGSISLMVWLAIKA